MIIEAVVAGDHVITLVLDCAAVAIVSVAAVDEQCSDDDDEEESKADTHSRSVDLEKVEPAGLVVDAVGGGARRAVFDVALGLRSSHDERRRNES